MADIRNDIADLQSKVYGRPMHSLEEDFSTVPDSGRQNQDPLDMGSGEDSKEAPPRTGAGPKRSRKRKPTRERTEWTNWNEWKSTKNTLSLVWILKWSAFLFNFLKKEHILCCLITDCLFLYDIQNFIYFLTKMSRLCQRMLFLLHIFRNLLFLYSTLKKSLIKTSFFLFNCKQSACVASFLCLQEELKQKNVEFYFLTLVHWVSSIAWTIVIFKTLFYQK